MQGLYNCSFADELRQVVCCRFLDSTRNFDKCLYFATSFLKTRQLCCRILWVFWLMHPNNLTMRATWKPRHESQQQATPRPGSPLRKHSVIYLLSTGDSLRADGMEGPHELCLSANESPTALGFPRLSSEMASSTVLAHQGPPAAWTKL